METNRVYLYPKTSCSNCVNCGGKKQDIPPKNYVKSNMSVPNCEYPKNFECYDRVYIESKDVYDQHGMETLNPQVYTSKLSPGYGLIPCNGPCNRPSFLSQDPRLYSVTLAQYLPLNSPPINGNVKLADVYDKKLDDYGNGYFPYKTVRDGQIQYYVDKSIQDPYFKPLFSYPAKEVKVLYKDPMDSVKAEFTRIPLSNTGNPVTTCQAEYECTSFIEDTQSHREDLMSFQMRKRNQQKWEALWN